MSTVPTQDQTALKDTDPLPYSGVWCICFSVCNSRGCKIVNYVYMWQTLDECRMCIERELLRFDQVSSGIVLGAGAGIEIRMARFANDNKSPGTAWNNVTDALEWHINNDLVDVSSLRYHQSHTSMPPPFGTVVKEFCPGMAIDLRSHYVAICDAVNTTLARDCGIWQSGILRIILLYVRPAAAFEVKWNRLTIPNQELKLNNEFLLSSSSPSKARAVRLVCSEPLYGAAMFSRFLSQSSEFRLDCILEQEVHLHGLLSYNAATCAPVRTMMLPIGQCISTNF